MTAYTVRAAHCDYRASEDQIYDTVCRITSPLDHSWERIESALPNGNPGLGVDIDEKVAARFPVVDPASPSNRWGNTRRADGTMVRP